MLGAAVQVQAERTPRSRATRSPGLTTFIVMSYIIFVNPSILVRGHQGPASQGPALRRRAHVHLSGGRRDDPPHGRRHQPRLRHRPRHGPQRGGRLQPGRRRGPHHEERHGHHPHGGHRHHHPRAHRLSRGDLPGHPAGAQEGDRHRHRLLHPVHRPRRRRHRGRRQRHAGHAGQPRSACRWPSPSSASWSRSSCWRAGWKARHPARHHLLDHPRDDPQLRLRQEAVRRRHRGDPAARSSPRPTSACWASSTSAPSASSASPPPSCGSSASCCRDFFDTMGTLIGVGGQAGYLDKKGDLPQVNRPLLVDSLAAVGRRRGLVPRRPPPTSSRAPASASGGRTGWVGVVVAVLFFAAMPSRRSPASCRPTPPRRRSSSSAT